MSTAYVLLTNGFEETEAIVPIDLMRRAGIRVVTVGLNGPQITGSHDITVLADMDGHGFVLPQDASLVVLPGGPGTAALRESPVVEDVLRAAASRGILIAAICAAPTVLHKYGLLAGKRSTAYPAEQPSLTGSTVTGAPVERDGNIITARAAGTSLEFGHALIEALLDRQRADEVLAKIYPAVQPEPNTTED